MSQRCFNKTVRSNGALAATPPRPAVSGSGYRRPPARLRSAIERSWYLAQGRRSGVRMSVPPGCPGHRTIGARNTERVSAGYRFQPSNYPPAGKPIHAWETALPLRFEAADARARNVTAGTRFPRAALTLRSKFFPASPGSFFPHPITRAEVRKPRKTTGFDGSKRRPKDEGRRERGRQGS